MTDPDPSPASERPPSLSHSPSPGTRLAPPETSQPVGPEQQQQQQPQQPQPDIEPVHVDEEAHAPRPLPFQPLYTLVTDGTSRATHHPRVHYIFADDEPEILTDALAQYSRNHQKDHQQSSPGGSTSTRPTATTTNPPRERAIVLDLIPKTAPNRTDDPTAAVAVAAADPEYEVSWASSLSADWAVVSAKLAPMAADTHPGTQTSESDDGAAPPQQRLMLRIDGVDISATSSGDLPFLPGNTTTGSASLPAAGRTRKKSSSSTTTTTTTTATTTGRQPSQESMSSSGAGAAVAAGGGGGGGGPPTTTTRGQGQGQPDYTAIVEEFDKRMSVLRKVVDAGAERQTRMAAAAAAAMATTAVSPDHQEEEEEEEEEGGGGGEPIAPAGVLGGDDEQAGEGGGLSPAPAATRLEREQGEGVQQEQAADGGQSVSGGGS